MLNTNGAQQEVQCTGCYRRSWGPLAELILPCLECGKPRIRTGRFQVPALATTTNPRNYHASVVDEVFKLHVPIGA